MLEFMLHRIKSNLLLYMLLLVGSITAAAIFSSIPMYSNGILQRVLIGELEQMQTEESLFPGTYIIRWEESNNNDKEIASKLDNVVSNQIFDRIDVETIESQKIIKSNFIRITKREGEINTLSTRFVGIKGISDHVNLIAGRMPANSNEPGVYEIIIGSNAAMELEFILDKVYALEKRDEIFMKVKVVGIFEPNTDSDFFWSENLFGNLRTSIVFEEDVFNEVVNLSDGIQITSMEWRQFYDYHTMKSEQVATLLEQYKSQTKLANESAYNLATDIYMQPVLERFVEREKILRITLWILTLPVLMITMFYTFMISRLIVKNDENEIAMLKSRGASTWQIFSMYLVQSSIMGAIAFIVGPLLGYFICNIIGASNGFLEFVNRVALPIRITTEVRLYALLAVGIYMIFILIPAFIASRTSIVQYKRNKNAVKSRTLWEKAFLDFIILGISYYGYYTFNMNQGILETNVTQGDAIDPLIFLISTLFLLGANLLILRIYPYIVRFVFWVGKKLWSPVLYFSLINVGRAEHNSRFIMLFIMLSLSFGILNSSQARTLNLNADDYVNYVNGADVVIKPYEEEVESLSPYANLFAESTVDDGIKDKAIDSVPFRSYANLDGIEAATKVFTTDEAVIRNGSTIILESRVLAFTPHEFAEVSWYRSDLLPVHLNEYMNIMTNAPAAALLSLDARDKYNIETGDEILLVWEGVTINVMVYGFVEYFPTYMPTVAVEGEVDEVGKQKYEDITFVIMNYGYLSNRIPGLEYDIWLKKDDGVSDNEIQVQLIEQELESKRVTYTDHDIVKEKNDPMLQGTNGILTMCFIITMLISVIGYLIFWIMTMKGRALKFGIFRAMGMSMGQVNRIIIYEQILMTGAAILFGSILGIIASKIFVPMLQMIGTAKSQVPPFVVVLQESDFYRTLFISGGMLFIGLIILFIIVRRFKVNQVIKLGED